MRAAADSIADLVRTETGALRIAAPSAFDIQTMSGKRAGISLSSVLARRYRLSQGECLDRPVPVRLASTPLRQQEHDALGRITIRMTRVILTLATSALRTVRKPATTTVDAIAAHEKVRTYRAESDADTTPCHHRMITAISQGMVGAGATHSPKASTVSVLSIRKYVPTPDRHAGVIRSASAWQSRIVSPSPCHYMPSALIC